jgi:hypothetical protein
LLKGGGILDRRALLTNGSGILQVEELALADPFRQPAKRKWRNPGDEET